MPPTPKKMTPTTPPSSSTGILSRAVPVSQLSNNWIHMLLYGRNRVGKTSLVCQFPKPLLLIALEQVESGGSRSVNRVPGVSVLRMSFTDPTAQMRSSEEIYQLGVELVEKEKCPVATVGIDSGTNLDEIKLAEICGWATTAEMLRYPRKGEAPKVTQEQYTERSEKVRRILRPFLDLKCNVVITANEKDHNPPEDSKRRGGLVKSVYDESFYAASMGGGVTRWLQDACDTCQLLIDKEYEEVTSVVNGQAITVPQETGKMVRKLRMMYHPNFSAGLRSPDWKNVPEFIIDPTYDKIKAVIEGRKIG